ncbi:MAG: hypothetical protein GY869_29885, partial [Planctomycetes bacterium]|nr:hypothetical protein [Planctomycetota bacterium]
MRFFEIIIIFALILMPVSAATGESQTAEKMKPPTSFDWRAKGIMTPVKHQGDCGSCGEFAAVTVFEALIRKATGLEVNLSEQQIVSCVPGCGCNAGCSSLAALKYMKNNGVVLESDFAYAEKDMPCKSNLRSTYYLTDVHSTVINKEPLNKRIEIIKNTILTFGPVATNMGLYDDLGSYQSGIYMYDGKAASHGGHWVTIIGWRDDTVVPSGGYWICRNSWGDKWGEEGYFKSAYGDQTGIDDYYIVYATFDPGHDDSKQKTSKP